MNFHAVMKHWHPMIGRDMHIPWPPGSPSPAPSPAPYVTTSTLLGLGITASYAPTHQSQGMGMTMQVGTDIGPMIPHMGTPSNLLPIEIPLSSSISYFGPGNYMAGGQPLAAALLGMTNPNLNCGTPVPLPLGEVIALNTHFVGMSLGDILGGMGAMLTDFAIQSALQRGGGRLTSKAGNYLAGTRLGSYLSNKVGSVVYQRTLFQQLMKGSKWPQTTALTAQWTWEKAVPHVLDEAVGQVAGFFTGGPMGADAATLGLWTPAGAGGEAAQETSRGVGEAVGDYLENPGIDEYPAGDYPTPDGDTRTA